MRLWYNDNQKSEQFNRSGVGGNLKMFEGIKHDGISPIVFTKGASLNEVLQIKVKP